MEKCVYLCRVYRTPRPDMGTGRDAVIAMALVVAIHNESVYLR